LLITASAATFFSIKFRSGKINFFFLVSSFYLEEEKEAEYQNTEEAKCTTAYSIKKKGRTHQYEYQLFSNTVLLSVS